MRHLPQPARLDPPPARLEELRAEVIACRACPRLVAWREQVATAKRASFAGESYWGRPVPGFGDPGAQLLVVGLAPAAHGGNRTGRVFTGDRSGDWLFRALWKQGWANQPSSIAVGDGLALKGAWVSCAVRCAPPANRPTTTERDACAIYLAKEMSLLGELKVIVALGAFAYQASTRLSGLRAPRFGHGVEVPVPGTTRTIICSYHPSQQNTFTKKLTEAAFDAVFARARALATGASSGDQDRPPTRARLS